MVRSSSSHRNITILPLFFLFSLIASMYRWEKYFRKSLLTWHEKSIKSFLSKTSLAKNISLYFLVLHFSFHSRRHFEFIIFYWFFFYIYICTLNVHTPFICIYENFLIFFAGSSRKHNSTNIFIKSVMAWNNDNLIKHFVFWSSFKSIMSCKTVEGARDMSNISEISATFVSG